MAAKKKATVKVADKKKKDDIIKLDDENISFEDALRIIADNSKPKK